MIELNGAGEQFHIRIFGDAEFCIEEEYPCAPQVEAVVHVLPLEIQQIGFHLEMSFVGSVGRFSLVRPVGTQGTEFPFCVLGHAKRRNKENGEEDVFHLSKVLGRSV